LANADELASAASRQGAIHVMTEAAAAELLERYIDFVDDEGRSVHCPTPFVRHYMRRDDGVLPPVVLVATLPTVSADGFMIYADGLDRNRGIVFNIEPALMTIIPTRSACDRAAVGDAKRFLLYDWLADVAADQPASAASSPSRSPSSSGRCRTSVPHGS
jgi:hypothetical protein